MEQILLHDKAMMKRTLHMAFATLSTVILCSSPRAEVTPRSPK